MIEDVLYIVGASVYCPVGIKPGIYESGSSDASYFQTIGAFINTVRIGRATLLALFAWPGCPDVLLMFFQTKLIPRWLSGSGIVAILLRLAHACWLCSTSSVLLRRSRSFCMSHRLQELALAVWLIVKGFNPSAIASLSAKTATNELLSAE